MTPKLHIFLFSSLIFALITGPALGRATEPDRPAINHKSMTADFDQLSAGLDQSTDPGTTLALRTESSVTSSTNLNNGIKAAPVNAATPNQPGGLHIDQLLSEPQLLVLFGAGLLFLAVLSRRLFSAGFP